MNTEKIKIHFTDTELLNPTNPIEVNLIGAGGTGSKVLTAMVEMHESLLALGHPGLSLRLWDDDMVCHPNLGRQRFAKSELGLYKSVALINRANRWAGTYWKSETVRFEMDRIGRLPDHAQASICISCVDSVKARFGIADILNAMEQDSAFRSRPKYWLDFGNSQHTGQAILATVGSIQQPKSERFHTVAWLPFITEEFGILLNQSEETDQIPSCSLAEALQKQDLFINSSLTQLGCSLLWNLFRNGMTPYRGFFHNLKDFRTQPLPVA